jgi:hypothetical protein
MAAIARYTADSTRPVWSAACDTCGDLGPRSTIDMESALGAAGREGWYAAPNAEAYCPRCAPPKPWPYQGGAALARAVASGQQHSDGTTVVLVEPDESS